MKAEGERPTIVVIDDDEAARLSIAQMLRLRDYEVEVFSSAEGALQWPALGQSMCVITDVKMPGLDGEQLLARVQEQELPPPVVMITGHGDIAMAVRCLKAGAFDFIEKPFDDEVLLAYVAKAVEQRRLLLESEALRRRLALLPAAEDGRYGMIGRSRPMQRLYEQIEVAAGTDASVLITGETGTGKELVARAIHGQSARAARPFVPVNAGALPETLLESELFGHARGSFTGATSQREGKLVMASGGTLLLDEIESIPLRAQVQLLRVLDDGIVEPLGSDRPRKVDIRLLASSNLDLQEEVRRGALREDFYHRIVVLSIDVPPLRERREDIPLLITHFLHQAGQRWGGSPPTLPDGSLQEMLGHDWPGNVRELRNAVDRLVITARDGVAGPFVPDLGAAPGDHETGPGTAGAAQEQPGRRRDQPGRLPSLPAGAGRLREELEARERSFIEAALRAHRGQLNPTYRALGISRRALYERMKKYGLDRVSFR